MAEQVVELAPAESKLVTFEAIPHEAKTYQVSVDDLTGSFVATESPVVDWVSPIGHSDPDSAWDYPEGAYDDDLSWVASTRIEPASWGSYLILLVNESNINKIKFYAHYTAVTISKVDIDVYYRGDWHHVYEGAFAPNEWVEKDIDEEAQLISKARVRFYNVALTTCPAIFNEFKFNTV